MRKIQIDATYASSRKLLICLSLLCVSAILFASSFSAAPGKLQPSTIASTTALQPITDLASTSTSSCPAAITQSSSQAIITGNSISCNTGTYHTDNSYWRAFDMATFTGGAQYCINSVSFGLEWANNSQPVTVRLYTTSNFPTGFPGSLIQIASTTVTVSGAQNGTVVTAPILASVPAGTPQLVMELFTPDGQTAGNMFFVGSNSAPETGASYISASACGITTPTATAAIGYPNMHIVFNVNGACATCPTPTPSPTACYITQSTSQAITTSFYTCQCGNSCGFAGLDTSYWRVFNMETFAAGNDFNVTAVSFGIYAAPTNYPVTVRLWVNATQIATTTINVTPAQNGTVVTTPLAATVPAGTSELLMEVFAPYRQSSLFKIGANRAPETGLSYWSGTCTSCFFPRDEHFVFNVYGSCIGGPASPTPTPTPFATATVTPCSVVFAEGFDSVVAPALPTGWVTDTFCSPPFWVTSTTTPANGPNDAFVEATYGPLGGAGNNDKRLDTPFIVIPSSGAQLSFRNFYRLATSCCDGAVLELSSPNINGGAFTDVTDAAVGGSFVTGGYNHAIDTSLSNPLEGRMAWTGNSGG